MQEMWNLDIKLLVSSEAMKRRQNDAKRLNRFLGGGMGFESGKNTFNFGVNVDQWDF